MIQMTLSFFLLKVLALGKNCILTICSLKQQQEQQYFSHIIIGKR